LALYIDLYDDLSGFLDEMHLSGGKSLRKILYFQSMDRFWKYKVDHIIFWVATVGFHMFTKIDLAKSAGIDHFLLEVIVRNGLLASLIYLNLMVLIPRYAQRRRIPSYTFLLLAALGLYVFFKNSFDVYLYGYVLGQEIHYDFFNNTYYNFSIAVLRQLQRSPSSK
jgi:two-component system LytT family sensor kinase